MKFLPIVSIFNILLVRNPLDLHSTKIDASLLMEDHCTIKRKTLQSACSRTHNQSNVFFAPSLLKIRARRFFLRLYSNNYFEQGIKNAVFFAQFTYVSIYTCAWSAVCSLQSANVRHRVGICQCQRI